MYGLAREESGQGPGFDDPDPVPDISDCWDVADQLREEGMLVGINHEWSDGEEGADDGSEIGDGGFDASDGFQEVVQLPPPVVGTLEATIWRTFVLRERCGFPPESGIELVLRETRRGVIDAGLGGSVSRGAVYVGIQLALASSIGERIPTHVRGIARHIGVRYQSLLQIRRIALAVIQRNGYVLGLTAEQGP